MTKVWKPIFILIAIYSLTLISLAVVGRDVWFDEGYSMLFVANKLTPFHNIFFLISGVFILVTGWMIYGQDG